MTSIIQYSTIHLEYFCIISIYQVKHNMLKHMKKNARSLINYTD